MLGSSGSTAIAGWQKKIFRLWPVRAVVGLFFLVRGLFLLVFDQYQGISSLCWVYRVSGVGVLRSIAYPIVTGFISQRIDNESRLVKAFLGSEAPVLCKKRFLGEAHNLDSMFRDFIVLKPSSEDEKGVLVLEYSQKFDLFIALFDLNRIMKDCEGSAKG